MRLLSTTLIALALLAGATDASAASRKVPRGWLGVTADGPLQASQGFEWRRMAANGAETVRTAFSWSEIEPGPPGAAGPAYEFGATDALALQAARHGLRLLPVVQRTPPWAAVRRADPASPPASATDVTRLYAALAHRYGRGGTLWSEHPSLRAMPVREWQVYNEPNLPGYWSTRPFAPTYVQALAAARSGLRSVDPRATVVLAGLPNDSWNALREIYAAGGRGQFDAVAVHPYTASPANVLRAIGLVRDVMDENGDRRVPIWVTEFSWPAARGRIASPAPWADFGDKGSARKLGRALRKLAKRRHDLRIARAVYYTWLTRERGESVFDYSGLRREKGGKRHDSPALRVFRRAARRLEGCAKSRSDARRCRRR
jgi:polysaccharide biosynthesis protein PslG